DIGSVNEVCIEDLFDDEILSLVSELNVNLGSVSDPFYDKYKDFMEDVNSTNVILINPDNISKNPYDTINLAEDEFHDEEERNIMVQEAYNTFFHKINSDGEKELLVKAHFDNTCDIDDHGYMVANEPNTYGFTEYPDYQ
ncbi:MAG: hypothetical protein R3Y24_14960, partial [Eubacteriales bacterium]